MHARFRRLPRLLHLLVIAALFAAALPSAAIADADAADAEFIKLKQADLKSRAVAHRLMQATVGLMPRSGESRTPGVQGMGSGVVVSEDGLILTAAHVTRATGRDLTIIFPDGKRASAISLGAIPNADAGMARITDPGPWPFVKIGNSAELKPGDWCLAIGHPAGVQRDRTPPVRLGRVLRVGRHSRFSEMITTDATVISGDSGGPLFDLDGRVIGIHSNIGLNVTQNNHVPIDVYTDAWDTLIAEPKPDAPEDPADQPTTDTAKTDAKPEPKPDAKPAPPSLPELPKLDDAKPDKPAKSDKPDPDAKPDPKPAPKNVDPARVRADVQKFQQLLKQRVEARDPEVLKLLRESGGQLKLSPQRMAELIEKWESKAGDEADDDDAEDDGDEGDDPAPRRGNRRTQSIPLPDIDRPLLGVGLDVDAERAVITQVVPDSAADDAGLKEGDIITAIDDADLPNAKAVIDQIANLQPGQRITIQFERDGKAMTARATLQRRVARGPDGKPLDPAALAELMKHAQRGPDGQLRLELNRENAAELMPLLQKLGIAGRPPQFVRHSKTQRQILQQFDRATASAADAIAVLEADGKPVALGLVVRADGLILTKRSELTDKLTCRLGDKTLDATIVAEDDAHDLALVRVDATGLKAAEISDIDPALGAWIITPGPDGKPITLGVVGVETRPIPRTPLYLNARINTNKAAVGIGLAPDPNRAVVAQAFPGGAAAEAGLKQGDVILAVDGQATPKAEDLVRKLGEYAAGDKIEIQYERDGKKAKTTATLKPAATLPPQINPRIDQLSRLAGATSKRRTAFPSAFTHDGLLSAELCGGPVVNLDGEIVGLNLARVSRTATYAIPGRQLRPVLQDLLESVE